MYFIIQNDQSRITKNALKKSNFRFTMVHRTRN